MAPKDRLKGNQHGDQFLVTFHQLPLERIPSDQHSDICRPVTRDGHVVLDLQHILIRDRVVPFPGLICRGSLGLEDAGAEVRVLADTVQIRQHAEHTAVAVPDVGLIPADDPAAGVIDRLLLYRPVKPREFQGVGAGRGLRDHRSEAMPRLLAHIHHGFYICRHFDFPPYLFYYVILTVDAVCLMCYNQAEVIWNGKYQYSRRRRPESTNRAHF